MSFLIHAYVGHTRDYTFPIYEDGGDPELTLAADDVVRVKIGANGDPPILELSSIEATDAGSIVTFMPGSGDCTLRIGQDDSVSLGVGQWDVAVAVVDASETAPANAIKHAEYGVLSMHPAQMGEVGLDAETSSSSSQSGSSGSSS